ncbi:thiopeptide-type bacteriocin biosynthesis protein [Streptomyces griseofuscus]|uniref:lantibiotic dehydratase n=1 Tax=Streptomyces griseofuscus TaxID=146922 RepID=UPI0036BC941F
MKSTVALVRVASLSVDEISGPAFGADRLCDDYVKQAIGLAAHPSLVTAPSEKADAALERYVTRMGGRATPFGLLAGTAFASTGAVRSLSITSRADHQVFVRVDTAVLESLVASAAGSAPPHLIEPGREAHDVAVDLLRAYGRADFAQALERLVASICGPRPIAHVTPDRLEHLWNASGLPDVAGRSAAARFHVDLDMAMPRPRVEAHTGGALDHALRRLQIMFPPADPLSAFKTAFQELYEDGEVPLSTVLDLRTGLLERTFTAGSALAQHAAVEPSAGPAADRSVSSAALRAYDHWRKTGTTYDMSGHGAADRPIARSVQAALLDNHENAFDAVLLSGQERSPMASLARFALSRPDREEDLRRWLEAHGEDQGEAIVAELVHAPAGRIGNVLQRPRLHAHTVYLGGGRGGALNIENLRVRLSNGRFLLRDGESGRPVILELNSTHSVDYRGNDARFRLLAHLSGMRSVGWRWGALSSLSHLPRVTCGRIIVSPERWVVGADDTRRILQAQDPSGALRDVLPGLGDREWVGCGTGDRLLPVNLRSPRAARAVLQRAVHNGRLDVTELPQIESPAVEGPGGKHVAEVCFPLAAAPRTTTRPPSPAAPAVNRNEWVYWKYYCSPFTADMVITAANEAVQNMRASGDASHWFFVRYGHGGHHVRVRVMPTAAAHRAAVVTRLEHLGATLRDQKISGRASSDCYVAEVARYGGAIGLAAAERIFCIDSGLVAAFLATKPSEEDRLLAAVAGLLHGVQAFYAEELSTRQLIDILRRRVSPLEAGGRLGSRYGSYFRTKRTELTAHMRAHRPEGQMTEALRDLRRRVPPASGETHACGEDIFRAVAHMHMNRLFARDVQRLERLAYDMAVRMLLERQAQELHAAGKR